MQTAGGSQATDADCQQHHSTAAELNGGAGHRTSISGIRSNHEHRMSRKLGWKSAHRKYASRRNIQPTVNDGRTDRPIGNGREFYRRIIPLPRSIPSGDAAGLLTASVVVFCRARWSFVPANVAKNQQRVVCRHDSEDRSSSPSRKYLPLKSRLPSVDGRRPNRLARNLLAVLMESFTSAAKIVSLTPKAFCFIRLRRCRRSDIRHGEKSCD